MAENVSGCYAQKPLAAIMRIIEASSRPKNLVLDLFAHSGATLLAAEILDRRCFTADIDPVYCELSILQLEICQCWFQFFGRKAKKWDLT